MRFLRLEKDEAIEDVAARLASSRSAAARERTLEALRRANPQLATDPRGAAGERILVIPDDLGPTSAAESAAAPQASVDTLIAETRARLTEATKVVPEQIGRQEERASAAVASLGSADVKRLTQGRPELTKQLAEVRSNAEDRVARLQFAKTLQAEALGAMQTDLEALSRLALERTSVGAAIVDLRGAFAPTPDRSTGAAGSKKTEPATGGAAGADTPTRATPGTRFKPVTGSEAATGATAGTGLRSSEPAPTTRTRTTSEPKRSPRGGTKKTPRRKKKKDED